MRGSRCWKALVEEARHSEGYRKQRRVAPQIVVVEIREGDVANNGTRRVVVGKPSGTRQAIEILATRIRKVISLIIPYPNQRYRIFSPCRKGMW